MNAALAQDHVLMSRFADVYAEMAEVRVAIRRGRLATYLAGGQPVSFAGPAELATALADRLGSRLDRQQKAIKDIGNVAEIKAYRQAQYVMVALVDELLLLDVDWQGAVAWQHELLERRFFGTSSAGRDFFRHLDGLLQLRGRGRLVTDLAAVYLLALQLGFQGQYRSRHGAQVLATYKTKLLRFIGWNGAAGDQGLMFPAAYRHLISEADDHRLAPVSRWLSIAAAVLLAYLALSSVVWLHGIHDFERLFTSG